MLTVPKDEEMERIIHCKDKEQNPEIERNGFVVHRFYRGLNLKYFVSGIFGGFRAPHSTFFQHSRTHRLKVVTITPPQL